MPAARSIGLGCVVYLFEERLRLLDALGAATNSNFLLVDWGRNVSRSNGRSPKKGCSSLRIS